MYERTLILISKDFMKKGLNPADKRLHDQFSEYGLRAKEWLRKCIILLPEIEKREIWKKKGFSSIYEYAAKIAGMSRSGVNEALRVFEKIADKPELQRVVEIRGINAIKPVVTIATQETAAFWAQKAKEMSKNTLETYVKEVRAGRLSEKENSGRLALDAACAKGRVSTGPDQEELLPRKASLTMEVDPEIAEKLEKLKGQDSWNDLMKELLELREAKLELEKPKSVETDSRYVSAKIRAYSLGKTRETCAFPGCAKPYKILHHTKRFALTNEHEPSSLQPLCKAHENIAHLGLIEHEEHTPKRWKILKFPNRSSPAYEVDMAVQRFRQMAKKADN